MFVLFTALAHSANPDVLAVSESWFRKATKNPEMSISKLTFSDKIELPKGAELQSTACCLGFKAGFLYSTLRYQLM